MLKKLGFTAVLGMALLSPMATKPADAQITAQSGGYLLRIKYVKGQTMKYVANMTMAQMGQPMRMNISSKVLDFQKGIATVEAKVTMSGGPSKTAPKPTTSTVKVDTRGRVVGGDSGSIAATGGPTLPEGPVKVGQSWNGTVKSMGGGNVKATYTLAGVKSVAGKQAAEITVKMNGDMGGSKMSGAGRMMLMMADGSLLNSSINMNFTVPSQSSSSKPQVMKMSMTMQRQ